MRKEAKAAAKREPLLVSFIYSTILNQNTLEAAVAFHLANKVIQAFPFSPNQTVWAPKKVNGISGLEGKCKVCTTVESIFNPKCNVLSSLNF